jgi:hypothetical protein
MKHECFLRTAPAPFVSRGEKLEERNSEGSGAWRVIDEKDWDVWVSDGVLVEVLRGEHISVARQFGVEWDGPESSAIHQAVFDDRVAPAPPAPAVHCECSLWSLCVRSLGRLVRRSGAESHRRVV